jgi:hypothetical protein
MKISETSHRRVDQGKQTLIFLHMPKTGGTTMHAILRRQYRAQHTFRTNPEQHLESVRLFRELPEEAKSKIELVTGHMRFGVHEHIRRSSFYLTFLRDPVQRVISYYYYILGYQNHYLHQKIKAGNMSLEDVLESGVSREFNNFQTRRISGQDRVDYGCCSHEMLEMAIRNIDLYFPIVGLTEKFDESLVLMSHYCKWRFPYYTKLNVGKHKPPKHNISEKVIEAIKQHNDLDIKLYDYASQKLQKQISDFGPAYAIQMKMFRGMNYSYGLFHSFRHRFR